MNTPLRVAADIGGTFTDIAVFLPDGRLATRKVPSTPDDYGRGQSADRSIGWDWKVDSKGGRHFRAMLWTGRRYELVINQKVAGK